MSLTAFDSCYRLKCSDTAETHGSCFLCQITGQRSALCTTIGYTPTSPQAGHVDGSRNTASPLSTETESVQRLVEPGSSYAAVGSAAVYMLNGSDALLISLELYLVFGQP
jgi:hypothetical protein